MIINNSDSVRFSLNGILVPKVYRARPYGSEHVLIENINNNERLIKESKFSDIVVDGQTYGTIEETINGINGVIYSGVGGSVSISDQSGNPIDEYNPLNTDGIKINPVDVDFDNSDFTDWVGTPEDLFKSPFSESLVNSTANNPKQIILAFKSTVKSLQIGLGENNGGDFSNVKISLLGSGGVTRSIYDNSTDDTKRNSLNVEFENELFNSLILEFNTADEVSLSNIIIFKSSYNTSQIQGVDNNGELRTVGATQRASLNVALKEYQGDAFGRLRVSEPYTIFDSSLTTEINNNLFWDELITANANTNYDRNTSSVELQVNATESGQGVLRQTKQRFKYQPGKSHEVLITGLFHPEAGMFKRVGLLDYDNIDNPVININNPQNGISLLVTTSGVFFEIWNNGSRTELVEQANFNIDKADGLGESGFTLDLNSTNIIFIDLEWLGVGAVRCGFVSSTGEIIVCHQFRHASNGFTNVYMRTANLPISYALVSGLAASGTMKAICSSVISEGGFNPKGILRALDVPSAGTLITANNPQSILGIRLKNDSFEFSVEINSISILAESSGDGKWKLLYNPTLDGTPVWNDVSNSVIQQSITSLDVIDDGITLATGLFSSDLDVSSAEIENSLKIGKDLAGNLDEVWLVIEPFTTETMHGSMNIRELL